MYIFLAYFGFHTQQSVEFYMAWIKVDGQTKEKTGRYGSFNS